MAAEVSSGHAVRQLFIRLEGEHVVVAILDDRYLEKFKKMAALAGCLLLR